MEVLWKLRSKLRYGDCSGAWDTVLMQNSCRVFGWRNSCDLLHRGGGRRTSSLLASVRAWPHVALANTSTGQAMSLHAFSWPWPRLVWLKSALLSLPPDPSICKWCSGLSDLHVADTRTAGLLKLEVHVMADSLVSSLHGGVLLLGLLSLPPTANLLPISCSRKFEYSTWASRLMLPMSNFVPCNGSWQKSSYSSVFPYASWDPSHSSGFSAPLSASSCLTSSWTLSGYQSQSPKPMDSNLQSLSSPRLTITQVLLLFGIGCSHSLPPEVFL